MPEHNRRLPSHWEEWPQNMQAAWLVLVGHYGLETNRIGRTRQKTALYVVTNKELPEYIGDVRIVREAPSPMPHVQRAPARAAGAAASPAPGAVEAP